MLGTYEIALNRLTKGQTTKRVKAAGDHAGKDEEAELCQRDKPCYRDGDNNKNEQTRSTWRVVTRIHKQNVDKVSTPVITPVL